MEVETADVERVEIEHHEMRPFVIGDRTKSGAFNHSHGSFLSVLSSSSCVLSYTRFAKTVVYLLLLFTCVPLIVGAAFTSIFIEDGNYNAAIVSFFTACLTLGTMSLFVLHLLAKMEKYHDTGTLEGLKILGMIMCVASGMSTGAYSILAFLNKQNFSLNGTNYVSSAAFSILCMLASLQLTFTAQWYQTALRALIYAELTANVQPVRSISAAVN